MLLREDHLDQIDRSKADVPGQDYFSLPEKVIQFGTGVLLRGLPDYFIDKANRQHVFNGRIVVVKSTGSGRSDDFSRQDNLYTICIRGLDEGRKIEKNIVSASVSRVLSAKEQWDDILRCAENPEIQVVISNTTEVGIALSDDLIGDAPPASFPGKLLAFLHHRYRAFHGDAGKGLVIIPTELILDNAARLKEILLTMAGRQSLETAFTEWLKQSNYFCSSLVDCIVPGRKPGMDTDLGYEDDLLIMTEVYRLWAIQSPDARVKDLLSFARTDDRVVIAPDIESFRELKLRLLNGAHSIGCALAIMAGFPLVREAMDAPAFEKFLRETMLEEIAPVITGGSITAAAAGNFSAQVIDRFKNPFIDHHWTSISLQYATKMRMRNVPLILKYTAKFGKPPARMALGFAAFLLFMKSEQKADGKYYGSLSGTEYIVQDDQAAYFSAQWKTQDSNQFLASVLKNQDLWGTDLSALPGFSRAVGEAMRLLTTEGAGTALNQYHKGEKTIA